MLYRFQTIACLVCLLLNSCNVLLGQSELFPGITAQDWPQWRGPRHDGSAPADSRVVTEWSQDRNVLWMADVPGRGSGSPIVVGDRVYLATCDEASGSQSLLAYERATGKAVWSTMIHASGAMRKNSKSTGASATPACDGQRLYITFANANAVSMTAVSLEGKQLWQSKISNYQIHQGYGASPLLYRSLVIGIADAKGGGAIVAFDRETGKAVWKRERPSAPNYASPVVFNVAGKDQLFLTGCDLVTSLNPLTGETLWETAGATTECVTTTVTDGKHIYSSGGYPKNHIAAIRADGSGKVAWENKERVYVPSLLLKDGYLYGVLDAGVAACWKADSGEEMWKSRLGGNFSSSPVLSGNQIYATNETGETFIFKANPEKYERIGSNQLGDEAFATPVICNGQIFMRVAFSSNGQRQEKLFCLGKK
jgi:outer membrane protein assembly factor BamB